MKVNKTIEYSSTVSKKLSIFIVDKGGKRTAVLTVEKNKFGLNQKELKGLYEALKEVFGETNVKTDSETTKVEDKTVQEIMSDEQAKQTAAKPTPMFKPATWVGAPPQ